MTNEIAIVLAAAIGVVGALAGAFVGPYFQRKHEHWRADREDDNLLRSKGAEIFDELDRITNESNAASIAVARNLFEENVEPSPLPDLGRIRLLVAAYFPTAVPIVSRYEEKNIELSKRLAETLRSASKSEVGARDIKSITALIVNERNQQSYQFVNDMRIEVANRIPRLK